MDRVQKGFQEGLGLTGRKGYRSLPFTFLLTISFGQTVFATLTNHNLAWLDLDLCSEIGRSAVFLFPYYSVFFCEIIPWT